MKLKLLKENDRFELLKKKVAFTLAEVLITLSILGVVAVIAIPNMIQKIQDRQQITMLKKTYAIVDNAFQMAFVEHGSVDNWFDEKGLEKINQSASGDLIGEVLFNYLNKQKFCRRSGAGAYDACLLSVNKYTGTVAWDSNMEVKCLNGGNCNGSIPSETGGYISLKNGATVAFSYICRPNSMCSPDRTYIGIVSIDTNGKKGPNRFGYDKFQIPYGKSGLLPNHNGNTGSGNYPKSNCINPRAAGQSCGRYAMTYGNMDYKRKDVSGIWK